MLILVAAVALGGWGVATYLGDRRERREARWEACAERVDPPEARSARFREFFEDDDEEAAIERLGREDRSAHRRIEAECGERP